MSLLKIAARVAAYPYRGPSVPFYVERDGQELELELRGTMEPFVRGRTSGPPEDCYPDEGGSADIDGVFLGGKPWTGKLTPEELEDAREAFMEAYPGDAEDREYDAAEDREYDDWERGRDSED